MRTPVTTTRRARRAVALLAATVGALVGVFVGVAAVLAPAAAAAAPGSWGAGQYPYLDGIVCTTEGGTGQLSSPLVAWDLGGGRSPGFTTSALTSDGTTDSAAPPLASVGAQSVADIAPGVDGFTSDADIATYAALLSRFGDAGGDTTAQVADAIVRKASGTSPGCVDTSQEAAVLQQAQQLAGPYTLAFDHPPAKLRPATPQPIAVVLTSAAGQPVPGATVQFTGQSVTFASAQATTDANGVATVRAAAADGTTSGVLTVQAQAALPTGLQQVNAQGAVSSTDPTGAVAAALVTAPPQPVTASTMLTADLSAHPVMHLTLADTALDIGSASTPRAVVTGLYGHRADVVFTIHGPAALRDGSLCADRTAADAGSAVAATSQVTITGDSTVNAGNWQPDRPGCYWISAALTTLDAVPTATASAQSDTAVTVLDTTVTVSVAQPLVGSDADVTGTATVAHDHGLASTLQVRLLGPVQPDPDATSCAGVDFGKAPTHDVGTGGAGGSDSGAPTFTAPTAAPGCYELAGALLVDVPGSNPVRVPIDRTAAAPQVLAVAPQVTYAMDQGWAYEHGSVSAAVTVVGTYNQPVHLTLRTERVPSATLDCRGTDYGAAATGPTGTAVVATRNLSTVTVRTAPLTRAGCYAVVPQLTVDANPAITAAGSFDALTCAVAVGPDPDARQAASPITTQLPGDGPVRPIVAALVFLLLCLLALSFALHTARRMAAEQQRTRSGFLLD
jgi:hypothetical protein